MIMHRMVLNYRVIVTPDQETGSGDSVFTAFCPTLGVADDGKTVEEALKNVQGAIKSYVDSLVEEDLPVPIDQPEHDFVTTTSIILHAQPRLA